MHKPDFRERRSFPRFPISMSLAYSKLNSDKRASAHTHDISAQGSGIITDEELPTGSSLDICLTMLDDGARIYKRGTVVWSCQLDFNKYRAGVQLEKPCLKPIPLVLRTIRAQRKY